MYAVIAVYHHHKHHHHHNNKNIILAAQQCGDLGLAPVAVVPVVATLSPVAGPVTGGLLLEQYYWGSVFLALIPVALAATSSGERGPSSRSRILPDLSSTQTIGAAMREMNRISGEMRLATPSGDRRAICLGTSSPTISDR